ncbi:MAG TPA: hypothetical protein VHA13_03415 [Gammaproteobacteria bacterium]|nr:hypothetical protein [Gammaproteobacteria bacterium]
MSSTRLVISNELLEALKQLHQAAIVFEKEHTTDGLYDKLLQKPLREQRDNTRIDFVEDFVINLTHIKIAKNEVEEKPDKIKYQISNAGIITTPIYRLLIEVQLLRNAFTSDINLYTLFDNVHKELTQLKLQAEKLLLLEYKNQLISLINTLTLLENAALQYKNQHQEDSLYKDALNQPLKQQIKSAEGLDFFNDLLENCRGLRSHQNDFDEKVENIDIQKISVKELESPVSRLLVEVSLFKNAPKINASEQKVCEEAINSLDELAHLNQRLR